MAPKKKVAINEETELSQDELYAWRETFRKLDPEGTGRVQSKDLVGLQIGVVTIDEALAKKLDKDKNGAPYEQIMLATYTKVPKGKIVGFFQRSVPDDQLKQFMDLFVKLEGKLTEEKLVEMNETVLNNPLTVEQFNSVGKPALTLQETLKLLFPSLDEAWLGRYTATYISPDQFQAVKEAYDAIDPDGKGFVTEKQFGEPVNLNGVVVDLAVFTQIDREGTGRISFARLLQHVYPNLRDPEACIKLYTPDKLQGFKEELQGCEADEEAQREKIEALEAEHLEWLEAVGWEGNDVLEPPEEGEEDERADARDMGAPTPEPEEIEAKEQAVVDAEEREDFEREEEAARWEIAIEEHVERLAAVEEQLMQARIVKQNQTSAELLTAFREQRAITA
mmetsp:Transcript_7826/g.13927  ORF Transcript_7826/g.13927 Transcript_7826/m.13927 type:complete len:393 (-) Transcript_7826:81-1259(-)